MEVWTWILAYIVGFSLLQLLVYRYFRDSGPSVEGPSVGDQYPSAVDQPERGAGLEEQTDDAGVYCQHCGAHNQQAGTIQYCRCCVSPLR